MSGHSHLTKITAKAKQLRKQHPAKKWTDLVKQAAQLLHGTVSKPKKAAVKKRAVKKRVVKKAVARKVAAARPATRAKKIKIKARRITITGITGVNMAELEKQVLHCQNLQKIQESTKVMLKDKRHKDAWPDLRRQLAKNEKAIAATKKYITALKGTI